MSDIRSGETGFISRKAFGEACRAFARCPGLRSSGMSVETRRYEDNQYLNITRALATHADQHFPTAQDLNDNHDSSKIEEDDDDDAAVYHSLPSHAIPSVEYHVIHSTSYRVPILYFFLHKPPHSISRSVDSIYEYLVPKQFQSGLRTVGVLGGISMTNHPLTDVPCFWLHPCNSAEAMSSILGGIEKDVSPIEYLVLWVGLVGNAVGLSLPKEILSQKHNVS